MPSTTLTEVPEEGILVADLMLECKLVKSKSEARRLIEQGGVLVGGDKVDNLETRVSADALKEGVVIRKGKKVFHKALLA
jgi:tyrosyl-tRNA synthetase